MLAFNKASWAVLFRAELDQHFEQIGANFQINQLSSILNTWEGDDANLTQ
jgi:hypothetical protein